MASLRTYYQRMIQVADLQRLRASAAVLRGLRDALPGTPFPAAFPALAALQRAGYGALEDLAGADLDELLGAGLSWAEAEAVRVRLGGTG